MDIVKLAFDMAQVVERFIKKAKRFYYLVMLFGYRCPRCKGTLDIASEGRCRCDVCSYECDPTVEFQRCSACGGVPILRVRRYQCSRCGGDIASKFLFDGLVFDSEYFRRKMAESRQRRKEQRKRVQEMLAQCRSGSLALEAGDLGSVPGLIDALKGLTADLEASVALELKERFSLERYQAHIRSYLGEEPTNLRDIPALIENTRLDLIWRFIAAIFLDHAGSLCIYQQDEMIWVMKLDDREGQDLPGEIEEAHGIKRPVGRVQAW